MPTPDTRQRLEAVRERMAAACARAGRAEDAVRLVAVSKRIDTDLVLAACRAGQWELGENRLPDALDRRAELEARLRAEGLDPARLRWHFIGHLQSRKARTAAGNFHLLHGVDSLKLARKLSELAVAAGRREPILLEVNAGREAQKDGLPMTGALDTALEAAALPGLDLRGMMTMAPFGAESRVLRGVFASLRDLNEEARRQTGLPLPELSMGMSGDFEEAILEGATLVRVGSAIFGPRGR
ncbi:YggS family pyridoxal phosphate-dependent enzyme [bacterium DOLJORAL78_65_58]|nr:MAG: YggS family pyridoxal phosphate-dependent enzyme [bacterium DOLZORAL124_64_63]PIE76694.1 MAG: YggS family pyridoxal phosphate-dependent enzyme [bacterium DOLJORAL78_65_58]